MKAAVLYEVNKPLVVEEVEIDGPGGGEGLGPFPRPAVPGHEAAAVVERVGEGVTYVQPGDHVVLSFVPWCGNCRYCVTGRPNLCGQGASRSQHLRKGEQRINLFASMSSFAEY